VFILTFLRDCKAGLQFRVYLRKPRKGPLLPHIGLILL